MSNHDFPTSSTRHAGFALIELMITVVVVAILASIAVPAYQAQIRKSRRTEARTAILDLAGLEERLLSVNNSYSQTPSDLNYPTASPPWPQTIGSGYYTVTVSAPAGATPTFIITANTAGAQTADTDCASFSIDQLGRQTATGSSTATVDCWK